MFRSKNSPKKEKLVTDDDYAVHEFFVKPNAIPANDSAIVVDMESDTNVTSEEDSELEIDSDSDNDYSDTESNDDE